MHPSFENILQLEDSEFARTAAVKGRQHAEQELVEAQTQLEEAQRLRSEAEERYLSTNRERSNIQSQVDDLEMELSEVMRKYKASVAQLSVDQITIQDQASQLTSLEQEKFNLKEQVRYHFVHSTHVVVCTSKNNENRIWSAYKNHFQLLYQCINHLPLNIMAVHFLVLLPLKPNDHQGIRQYPWSHLAYTVGNFRDTDLLFLGGWAVF